LTLTIQKFSQFPLIFNYRENFADVRSASFLLSKGLLKSFRGSVEIWCDFPNVAIFGIPRLLAAGQFSTPHWWHIFGRLAHESTCHHPLQADLTWFRGLVSTYISSPEHQNSSSLESPTKVYTKVEKVRQPLKTKFHDLIYYGIDLYKSRRPYVLAAPRKCRHVRSGKY
jgi:hypothetical protein